jgi:hypothetical protein
MAEKTAKKTTVPKQRATAKSTQKKAAAEPKSAVDKTVDLSEDVLKSVEAGQRAAIDAVRKFVETVDEALPGGGDGPTRREKVIDAALEMADRLVTTQYEFLHKVVHDAGHALERTGAKKK